MAVTWKKPTTDYEKICAVLSALAPGAYKTQSSDKNFHVYLPGKNYIFERETGDLVKIIIKPDVGQK